MQQNWGILVAAIFVMIFTEIALLCCRKMARKVPTNYILLLIFTLCETYLVGNICSYYALSQPGIVQVAGLGTSVITAACTLYAFTTKTDFTIMGGLIWLLSFSLMLLILFTWIIGGIYNSFVNNAIISLCIFLMGIFLIYDTQLIVGKGKHKLSLDDYVIGALIIYVDIITIFLYILALFGKK